MFGLLRFRRSCHKDATWNTWRLHYCGTCKTIGRAYGQAARMLLNHDTVFLAETLTTLSTRQQPLVNWDPNLRSFNCFSLPSQSPLALRFAAAATVVLSEYKLRDHVEDSATWRRRFSRWGLHFWNPRFRRAVRELRELEFDFDALDRALSSQQQAEREARSLETLAAPTATAVSMFFAHGATLIGRHNLRNSLATFGSALGTLVYLLDAFEDQNRDEQRGEFNALQALGLNREQAIAQIDELSARTSQILREIDAPFGSAFAARLNANLSPRLGRRVAKGAACCKPSNERLSWTKAWDRAEELAEGRAWPVLAAVALSVFIFPEHGRAAESADECMSLGANLMALSSLVAVAIGRKRRAAAAAAATGGADAASGGGGCCCGDLCSSVECCVDGCDCCCECGECDCGACDCGGCCDC